MIFAPSLTTGRKNTVTVRKQGGEDLGSMSVEAFVAYVNAEIEKQLN